MERKICAITGCNSGIGKHTAIGLAREGYEIIMLVRNSEKSANALQEIREASGSVAVELIPVDLASLQSIKSAAEIISGKYPKIDRLINNAGIYKREKQASADGFELTLAVNYFAPFVLTNKLLPLLKQSAEGRIINLSSQIYKQGKVRLQNQFTMEKYSGFQAYADSKLLLTIFTQTLAEKLKDTSVTVNALHPGAIGTEIFRDYPRWLLKILNRLMTSPKDGAHASIYLATAGDLQHVTGAYFNKTNQEKTVRKANDAALAGRIWETTARLTASDAA